MMLAALSAPLPFWPHRRWWLALLLILVAAAALRYTGYNFSLPYVDHPDEPNFNIAGRMIIDAGSPMPLNMHGYPPGIIAVNYVFLRLFHDPATPPSTVIWMVRLVSITFTLGTLVLIGLIGYRLGSSLGGLIGAGLWAVLTIIIEYSRYATADNFVTFFSLLALFLALTGTLYDRDRWATWSMAALMLAIVFKYQAMFLLPLVLLIPLRRLRYGAARGRVLRNLAGNSGWLAVFFFWLIFLYPSLEADKVPNWVARTGKLGLPTLSNLAANIQSMIAPLNLGLLWIPVLVGLALWVRSAKPRDRFGLAAVIAAAMLIVIGISVYGEQAFRQFMANAALLCVLAGIGLAAWVPLMTRFLSSVWHEPRRLPAMSAGAVIVLVALALLPQVSASVANALDHTLPDKRNDLARWIDMSLMPGRHIADRDNEKTLNGAWGGYAGRNAFPQEDVAHLADRPLDEWRAASVVYAIEDYETYEALSETDEGRALLDQTLLLKSFPPDRGYRGPSMVVLRLYPIQHEAEGQLGPVHFVGYDSDTPRAAPGDNLDFTLYWQAEQPLEGDYAVFNHLLANDGTLVAQIDGSPLPDERRTTATWDDPDETLVSRGFALALPGDLPPGTYRLVTGFYRRDTGARLPTPDGQDSLLVTTIEVLPDA